MLLHEADAVEFIYQMMVTKEHKHTLYQLSSGEKYHGMTLLRQLLRE